MLCIFRRKTERTIHLSRQSDDHAIHVPFRHDLLNPPRYRLLRTALDRLQWMRQHAQFIREGDASARFSQIETQNLLHCNASGNFATRFLIFSAWCRWQTSTASRVLTTIRLFTPRRATLLPASSKTMLSPASRVVRPQLAALPLLSFEKYRATDCQPP